MPSPNRYAKGVAKRAEILGVALDEIARRGYRQSTLRDIADAVGLTNAGVLHYFESKEDLFVEVLRLRDETDQARSEGADVISDFVEALRRNAEVPGLVQLYVSLAASAVDPDHPAHPFFVERTARLRRRLADGFTRLRRDGRLPADADVDELARTLIAVADGLQTQWLVDPDLDMARHVAAFLLVVGLDRGDADLVTQIGETP